MLKQIFQVNDTLVPNNIKAFKLDNGVIVLRTDKGENNYVNETYAELGILLETGVITKEERMKKCNELGGH